VIEGRIRKDIPLQAYRLLGCLAFDKHRQEVSRLV
jgi:hypothetical protein